MRRLIGCSRPVVVWWVIYWPHALSRLTRGPTERQSHCFFHWLALTVALLLLICHQILLFSPVAVRIPRLLCAFCFSHIDLLVCKFFERVFSRCELPPQCWKGWCCFYIVRPRFLFSLKGCGVANWILGWSNTAPVKDNEWIQGAHSWGLLTNKQDLQYSRVFTPSFFHSCHLFAKSHLLMCPRGQITSGMIRCFLFTSQVTCNGLNVTSANVAFRGFCKVCPWRDGSPGPPSHDRLVSRGSNFTMKQILSTITPPTVWSVDIRQVGSMESCFWLLYLQVFMPTVQRPLVIQMKCIKVKLELTLDHS